MQDLLLGAKYLSIAAKTVRGRGLQS